MNLTYETTDNGYKIFNNGVLWIVQDGYIPFPADTMAQSAELHIQDILREQTVTNTLEDKISELNQNQLTIMEALTDIYAALPTTTT